ncbi:hypothetical protein RUM43_008869 [Polyplax serrata]|uniref:Uncharacterized protein n=1 Tax=Polyplax serrata TaxID=468196 RepID=A0AAN8PAZ2_POLSC
MATVIQKCWRGYWTRSNVFSYYKLKSWLAFVAQQNKLLKSLAEANKSKNNMVEMMQREEEAKEWIIYILFKLHHLLRTHQLSGIYSLPYTTELSEIEKMLKSLKYKDFMVFYNAYMDDVRQSKAKELPGYILQRCKNGAHYEREYYEHKKPVKEYLLSREVYKSQTPVLDIEIKDMLKSKKRLYSTYQEAQQNGESSEN